jgi:hypothetical protein
MNLELLQERHNFKSGDDVVVFERSNPGLCYSGKIYRIIALPANKYIHRYKNILVDYFYISFPNEIYNLLLKRGSEVIYNHNPVIIGEIITDKIGKIQKLYKQERFSGEYEIKFDNINALLIWRAAYNIKSN